MQASVFMKTAVRGINDRLVQAGDIGWPSEKVGHAVSDEIAVKLAESYNGEQILPEGGLDAERTLGVRNLLKAASDNLIKRGVRLDAGLKTASAQEPLEKRASRVAIDAMERTAADASLTDVGTNTPESAATDEQVARLDQKNRPQGKYNIGVGKTEMPDGQPQGREMPHFEGPSNSPPLSNSLTEHSSKAAAMKLAAGPGFDPTEGYGQLSNILEQPGPSSMGVGDKLQSARTFGLRTLLPKTTAGRIGAGGVAAGVLAALGYGGYKLYQHFMNKGHSHEDALAAAHQISQSGQMDGLNQGMSEHFASAMDALPAGEKTAAIKIANENNLENRVALCDYLLAQQKLAFSPEEFMKTAFPSFKDSPMALRMLGMGERAAALPGQAMGAMGRGMESGASKLLELYGKHPTATPLLGAAAALPVGAGITYGGLKGVQALYHHFKGQGMGDEEAQQAAMALSQEGSPNGEGSPDGEGSSDSMHFASLKTAEPETNAPPVAHPEPDADNAGGPSDADADNLPPELMAKIEEFVKALLGKFQGEGPASPEAAAALPGLAAHPQGLEAMAHVIESAKTAAEADAMLTELLKLNPGLSKVASFNTVQKIQGALTKNAGVKDLLKKLNPFKGKAEKEESMTTPHAPETNEGDKPEKTEHEKKEKEATFRNILKRAAEGSLTPVGKNTPESAAKDEQTAALDQKNRPQGKYVVEQGKTQMDNIGQEYKVKTPEKAPKPTHPDTTPAREAKSAELTQDETEYVASFRKTAEAWGPKLPAAMPQDQKIAALREIMSLPPQARSEYIDRLFAR